MPRTRQKNVLLARMVASEQKCCWSVVKFIRFCCFSVHSCLGDYEQFVRSCSPDRRSSGTEIPPGISNLTANIWRWHEAFNDRFSQFFLCWWIGAFRWIFTFLQEIVHYTDITSHDCLLLIQMAFRAIQKPKERWPKKWKWGKTGQKPFYLTHGYDDKWRGKRPSAIRLHLFYLCFEMGNFRRFLFLFETLNSKSSANKLDEWGAQLHRMDAWDTPQTCRTFNFIGDMALIERIAGWLCGFRRLLADVRGGVATSCPSRRDFCPFFRWRETFVLSSVSVVVVVVVSTMLCIFSCQWIDFRVEGRGMLWFRQVADAYQFSCCLLFIDLYSHVFFPSFLFSFSYSFNGIVSILGHPFTGDVGPTHHRQILIANGGQCDVQRRSAHKSHLPIPEQLAPAHQSDAERRRRPLYVSSVNPSAACVRHQCDRNAWV